jgi:hypothetical protein
MSSEVSSNLLDYINKFKGTDDIHDIYREFEFKWLNSFDETHVDSVRINFECIRNERIWGDGDNDELVIDDFINSLECLLKE